MKSYHSPRQPPDSAMVRSWVKDKLNTIPSTYSKYDEGMRAIKIQIQQDFFPEYQNLVMQTFYQEFYAIEVVSGETGERLWARWKANHRMQLERCRRTSSIYSTADIEDAVDSRHLEASTSQNRKAVLDVLAGHDQSAGATIERQKRTSVLISEAEVKLLNNRDSNYWGDLAIPVFSQTVGKAKIVYIPPKSARNTVSIEKQQLSIDQSVLVGTLNRHGPNGNLRRNSLPAHTSLIDGSDPKAIIKKEPTQFRSNAPLSVAGVKGTTYEYVAAGSITVPLQQSVAALSAKRSYSDDLFLPYPNSTSFTPTSNATIENTRSRFERMFQGDVTHASSTDTFGRSTKIRHNFSSYGGHEGACSHSERSYPATTLTGGNLGGTTKRQEADCLKTPNCHYSVGVHLSPSNNTGLAVRTGGSNALGIHLGGMCLHEVHQGHGTLGTRSPAVVSMMASPTTVSFVTGGGGGLYPVGNPQTTKRPTEHLVPTPPSSREHSPFPFYELPEGSYSGSSRYSSSDSRAGGSAEAFYPFDLPSAREYHDHSPSDRTGRGLGPQNGTMYAGTESSHISKTPEATHTQEPLWHGKSLTSFDQYQRSLYDQLVSNSAPATRSNSSETSRIEEELNVTTSYPGATPKLRSRFSFVLPNMHLGSRTAAHNTCKRSSLQSPGLKVTREVLREEEEYVTGNPSRATFTAHVPRFGKDPMKEIHRAHTKYETKRPAFLRAIQDGIDFARKASPKPGTSDTRSLRTPPKQHGKINKLTISKPMHDGNPLKMSNSTATPHVLKNATPIHGLTGSDSVPSQDLAKRSIILRNLPTLSPHVASKPRTVLMPWELDKTPMAADEFLSSGDEYENAKGIQQVGRTLSKDEGQPTITIDPFSQGALYSWIECSVVQACSDFLRQQQKHLNLDLLKKEVKKWKNSQVKLSTGEARPRDSPVEFMFGMEVQCKLLEGNYKTLHFSGPSAMNAITVINAWKNIIPSFSPRTFCFPDYLILEHLRVTEKVLRLFGPAYWDCTMFEMKRAQIVKRIMEAGQSRKEWSKTEKMVKLQRDREKAEASLLQAVGIWSTDDTPVETPEIIGGSEGSQQEGL